MCGAMSKTKKQLDTEKVFAKLFQEYELDIYRVAFVYVKNKEDALDVVQEAAYRALLNFKTLKDLQKFRPWVIKITINCAMDLLRKNKKVYYFDNLQLDVVSDKSEDIPLSLSLQDLLEELKEDEKTVLLLKYYQGYTFANISEILSTPESTVKTVLYRALQKLRARARGTDMYG